MTALGFGGVFTSFTYVAPQLGEISGFPKAGVTALLVLFGVAPRSARQPAAGWQTTGD